MRPVRVALDLLGGDRAPDAVVDGALAALSTDPELHLVLAGPAELRQRWAAVADRVTLLPTDESVGMADAPVRAVRSRRTSVRLAVEAVRHGAAEAVVSVGSTGALVAAAVTELGKLSGFRRPALAAVLPAVAHPVVLVDVGAHAGASDADLVRHGRLGAAFARTVLGLDRPRVGLLSVGTEPGKGDALRRKADRGLAGSGLNYIGLVEGYDVPLGGRADVVVTDGFTGNVVLKTLEGALALTERGATSPRAATLLGVAGHVVVGHGAASPADVADCIAVATRAARENHLARLRTMLENPGSTPDPAPSEPAADTPAAQPRDGAPIETASARAGRSENRLQARTTAAPAAT
ncbi:hypothetical protein GCM10009539_79440 [Cryptosporangium japonicum]|uniref:Phosphate acyltransferase n=1 Tax=Cryptosporangium japonicum TaxID=80872 RepID=A0ABP3EY52_9ACTN